MNIQQQFILNELLDPFTLLEVCQALREITPGDSLELLYRGRKVPDELFKVLPSEEYEMVEQKFNENLQCFRIVIQKKTGPSLDPEHSTKRWCCS